MRRRRKRHNPSEVELNLAAMLDMAFQLLTFFILTFRPPPLEGQISLRLPPPQPISGSKTGQQLGDDQNNTNPLKNLDTLTISVFADPKTGEVVSLGVGGPSQSEAQPIGGLAALEGRLKELFADPGNPFEQVIIQVSESCRYDELMKIVDICTRQKLPNGKPLSKLSFVDLPSG
ncbi:MAG: biopolymer transporter ExbD [Thermoguttaceae bacterium]